MGQIVQLCDGVYHRDDHLIGPETLVFEGRELHRFMDMFYIEGTTEQLTPHAVSVVCRARARNMPRLGAVNSEVHKIFRALVFRQAPRRLLEIGAGTNPVLNAADLNILTSLEYVTCDADPATDSGQPLFSANDSALPCASEFFEMAISVFVLHFRFYDEQIREVYRCLAPTGVFVANVYRRTDQSLEQLAASFGAAGFFVQRLLDPRELCEGHQYWVCAKHENVAARVMADIALLAENVTIANSN